MTSCFLLGGCAAHSPQLPRCTQRERKSLLDVVKREHLISHECKARFHSSIKSSQLYTLSLPATRDAGERFHAVCPPAPRFLPKRCWSCPGPKGSPCPPPSDCCCISSPRFNVKGRAPMQTCDRLLGLILPIHWVTFVLPGNCCPSALRKTASCRSDACQLLFVAWRGAGAGKAAPVGGGGAGTAGAAGVPGRRGSISPSAGAALQELLLRPRRAVRARALSRPFCTGGKRGFLHSVGGLRFWVTSRSREGSHLPAGVVALAPRSRRCPSTTIPCHCPPEGP